MKNFDSRLVAIANCPILSPKQTQKGKVNKNQKNKVNKKQKEFEGSIRFNPYPVIIASCNLTLSHELCHLLAGKKDYDIFKTAIIVRDDDQKFAWVLNALYDWYHENVRRDEVTLISTNLMLLRQKLKIDDPKNDKELAILVYLLNNEVPLEEGERLLKHTVRDAIDLVVIADKLCETIKTDCKKVCYLLSRSRTSRLYSMNKNDLPLVASEYYTLAISKYYPVIKELSTLWLRNKYGWINSYFGEINWGNLPLLMLGDEIGLPVFKSMSKIVLERNVYIAIDKSGSTCNITTDIMDTAVIITESFIMAKTPVSIIDFGRSNKIVNDLHTPVERKWFTPKVGGGTPLGEVLLKINDSNPESLLIIITDGEPDYWDTLEKALNKFKGEYVSFVIGDSYREYQKRIKNVIPVTPNNIIRNLKAYDKGLLNFN